MSRKELDFILQEGEGLKIEFKESLKNIDKEMVAFANSEGGRIFLGISDDNTIKGIMINNRLKSQVQDMANNCDPAVKIKLEESDGVIKEMLLSQGPVRFDKQLKEFDSKDFDKIAFADYLKRANIGYSRDKDNILFNLGVQDQGKLTNTGVLFFSKNPKKYLINAYVTCARYKGTEKVKVIDRKDIEANLIRQVEDSIKFIERNTMVEYEIKGLERKEIPEYPIEALREAVLNAVMHRDYFETGANVQIDILDDRISITNIGGLIKPLTKDKLGKIAVRRNPLIADLFHRVGLVEKMVPESI